MASINPILLLALELLFSVMLRKNLLSTPMRLFVSLPMKKWQFASSGIDLVIGYSLTLLELSGFSLWTFSNNFLSRVSNILSSPPW